MINRRFALVALLLLVFVWSINQLPLQDYSSSAWQRAKQSLKTGTSSSSEPGSALSSTDPAGWAAPASPSSRSPAANYFEQVFSVGEPEPFDFATLKDACAAADWDADEAYLNCVGILAGMTSIVSQVKVCLKMAVESGSHLVLPRMPLRSSENLLDFNFFNEAAYMPYDQWFDADHLRAQLARACPRMRLVHPDDLGTPAAPVAHRFQILCSDAHGYSKLHSYFWVGRPFRPFFREQFRRHMDEIAKSEEPAGALTAANSTAAAAAAASAPGITVVDIDSEFMVFRLTDDPTGRDLRLWTDLSHLVRFRQDVRTIVDRLVRRLPPVGSYYGVHFRAENDSIWSSADHQLGVDLDALDRAWASFGEREKEAEEKRPLVYLACGDAKQIERFAAAAAERGWDVTHKWQLAGQDADGSGDAETTALIDALAFDFQGAVDMGVMVRSGFFIGIQGSAFSSTIANQRDLTGRYRGSSFDVPDAGARTHLFNDLDATEYACCL